MSCSFILRDVFSIYYYNPSFSKYSKPSYRIVCLSNSTYVVSFIPKQCCVSVFVGLHHYEYKHEQNAQIMHAFNENISHFLVVIKEKAIFLMRDIFFSHFGLFIFL